MTDGISIDKICHYASDSCGMLATEHEDRETSRHIAWLLAEGYIEERVRTVHVPAVNMPESCKQVAMFDTWSARTVTLTTYHLVKWPENK